MRLKIIQSLEEMGDSGAEALTYLVGKQVQGQLSSRDDYEQHLSPKLKQSRQSVS